MPHPRGRQPIGVNQPPSGGSDYPFVSTPESIKHLLADFFLSFDDLSDQFVFPFRVAWLYGFGTVNVPAIPGYPTPTHAYDIVVVDAEDNIVFDSTQATTFYSDVWDNRLRVLEWQLNDKVLRCTTHINWTEADIANGLDRSYDLHIAPIGAELQNDTCYKLPKRVTSLQVGLVNIAKTRVMFREGYNVGLQLNSDTSIPDVEIPSFLNTVAQGQGERVGTSIILSAAPGSGLGVFPGCDQEELYLRTINGVKSNSHQNFTWDAEGCIRYQRPVGLISSSPRVFDYGSFDLTQSEAASAIEVLNDCQNCCDCNYFARTYQGIKRQWFLHRDVAIVAEAARDMLAVNIDRWQTQKDIREANQIKILLRADGASKVTWGISYCNTSTCCLQNITFRLTWYTYVNGELTLPARGIYDCDTTQLEGAGACDGPLNIKLSYDGNYGLTGDAFVPIADPSSILTLTGRHCFRDADDLQYGDFRVRLYLVVLVENPVSHDLNACDGYSERSTDIDPDALTIWAADGIAPPEQASSAKLSNIIDVDSRSAYCRRCACD